MSLIRARRCAPNLLESKYYGRKRFIRFALAGVESHGKLLCGAPLLANRQAGNCNFVIANGERVVAEMVLATSYHRTQSQARLLRRL